MSSSNQPSPMRQLLSPMSLLLYAVFIILGFFLHRITYSDSVHPPKFQQLPWATAKQYLLNPISTHDSLPNQGSYVDMDSALIDSIRLFSKHKSISGSGLVRIYLGSATKKGYLFLSPINPETGTDTQTIGISYIEPAKIKLPCPRYCDLQSTALGQ